MGDLVRTGVRSGPGSGVRSVSGGSGVAANHCVDGGEANKNIEKSGKKKKGKEGFYSVVSNFTSCNISSSAVVTSCRFQCCLGAAEDTQVICSLTKSEMETLDSQKTLGMTTFIKV